MEAEPKIDYYSQLIKGNIHSVIEDLKKKSTIETNISHKHMLIVLEDYYCKGIENLPSIYDKLNDLRLKCEKLSDSDQQQLQMEIIAIDYNLGVIAFLRKMYSMAYDHLKKISFDKKMMNESKCPLLLIRTSLLLVDIFAHFKYIDAALNMVRYLEKEGNHLIECSEKLVSQEDPGIDTVNHIATGICYNEHWKISKSELDFLIKIYKAKIFSIDQKWSSKVDDELKDAEKHIKNLHPDKVVGDKIILKHLHSHYIAMLDSAKAFLQHDNYRKCLNSLSLNPEGYSLHPICEGSNIDSNIKSLSHPCIFFNNIGVAHLRMKKCALALYYFKKAYKNIPKRHKLIETNQLTKSITNHSSNIRYELKYNMGLCRYLLGDYALAFQCFEQSLTLKKDSYQTWYRMGLCCLRKSINTIINRKESHSLIQSSLGYEGQKSLSRVILATSPKEITCIQNSNNDVDELVGSEEDNRMSYYLGRSYFMNALKLYKYKKPLADYYKAVSEKIIEGNSSEGVKDFNVTGIDIFSAIDDAFVGNCVQYIVYK